MDKYLESIHPNMYFKKLSYDTNDFITEYKNNIHTPTKQEHDMLTTKINDYIHSYHIYQRTPWKFLISTNLEQDMCYTLEDYIIIPKNIVQSVRYKTLLHEKTHLIQRNHQDLFNEWYKTHYPEFKDVYPIDVLPEFIRRNVMINPDCNETIWTNQDNYYLYFKYNNNQLKVYMCDEEGNEMEADSPYDHPNEKFAYELCDYLNSNNTIPSHIDDLLSSLE